MLLQNKVAIVTGGGRGIGRTIAELLAANGAKIAVLELVREIAEETCNIIKGRGGEASAYNVDVRNSVMVNEVVNNVVDKYGQIDILVNNAGVTRDGLMMKMKDEEWDFVLDTNLKGCFYMTRAVVRPMIKNRSGRIINISSVIGLVGNSGQANYSASKAGLIGLTKTTAKELASRGICVNAIAPGFIETDMTRKLDETQRANIQKNIALGFLGEPIDVANAVLFLSSDMARYITGQVLTVDGGMVF